LAARIEQNHEITPELIPGRGGIFDVEVDGKLIFSKHDEGRFPEDSEILSQIG
jgi:selenoprotein W-related protein